MNIYNCHPYANCVNAIGSYECQCKIGYYGNGIECSPCPENYYSFNDTTCLPCPENSISLPIHGSILDCKCNSFNHYPNNQTSSCLPCDYGFKVDEILNVCQSNFFFIFIFNIFTFFFLKRNKNKNKNKKGKS